MSLANMKDLLNQARQGNYAVGMFVMYDIEMATGLIQAAEETNSPLIMAYGELAEELVSIRHLSKAVHSMIGEAKVPIALHWDHGSGLDIAALALRSGFTSVMIDASAEDFETNIAITKQVIEMCRPHGTAVEGELGQVGHGKNYDPDNYLYTDPAQAAEYVRRTGVDALAVAVGNSHGVYAREPKINFDALEKLREAVEVPLVLHGASGISDADIRKAVSCGITKINIFTDMCMCALDKIGTLMSGGGAALEDVSQSVIDGVREVAIGKIKLFGSEGKVK